MTKANEHQIDVTIDKFGVRMRFRPGEGCDVPLPDHHDVECVVPEWAVEDLYKLLRAIEDDGECPRDALSDEALEMVGGDE